MDPTELIPNWRLGLSNVGFLFGAGASKEAGFPLTQELTVSVLDQLEPEALSLVEDLMDREEISFDPQGGVPDIESISDTVQKYLVSGGIGGLEELETSLQHLIVDGIVRVKDPRLETHIAFLDALRRKVGARAQVVWILTTNYDLAFELAAAKARVPIYNGFEGVGSRFFDIRRLSLRHGRTQDGRFQENRELTVRILKLHGSVSWFRDGAETYETFADPPSSKGSRALILPRRKKVLDVLESPFGQLYRYADSVLGSDCKYLVSCGYSFRDEHINDLIFPKCQERNLRLTVLCEALPTEVASHDHSPSIGYVTPSRKKVDGKLVDEGESVWRFNELVGLLNS